MPFPAAHPRIGHIREYPMGTERSCAAPITEMESHISDTSTVHTKPAQKANCYNVNIALVLL